MGDLLKKEAAGMIQRVVNRDFSGNTGLAIKNSIYQLATNIVSKIGSLLFTVIIARMLMPELFGLYSLALSTILIFAAFSDLGIGSAFIRFASKYSRRSKAYFDYLFKLKSILTLGVIAALLISAYFIATYYYQKPIILALLAGALYILAVSFLGLFTSVFQAENDFKIPFYKEIFFQVIRLIILPLVIWLAISSSTELLMMYVIISLSICYFLAIVFLKVKSEKYNHGESKLTPEQKKRLLIFLLPLSATALSGVFFGYIDTIMLGRFVDAEFIAYYQGALSLVTSAMVLISFGGVLFPIFSKLSGKSLLRGLRKAVLYTLPLSIGGIILTFFLASPAVYYIYGAAYMPAASIVKILALILLTDPLIGIMSSYLISQGRNVKVAWALIISTIINIVLNYLLITFGMGYGMLYAAFGAATATIISRFAYLGLLIKK